MEACAEQIFYVVWEYYTRTWFGFNWQICTHVKYICENMIQMLEYYMTLNISLCDAVK